MSAGPDGDGTLEVRTAGWLHLAGDDPALVAVGLVYRPRDCLAASMVMRGPDGVEVTWTFGWELLHTGLTRPVGPGDVRVGPLRGAIPMVEVVLTGAYRVAVRLAAGDVADFVGLVASCAPADTWRIGQALETELAAIAAGSRARGSDEPAGPGAADRRVQPRSEDEGWMV